MLILNDLWKGDCSIGENYYQPEYEYSRVLRTMEKCEKHLREVLSEEDWAVFQQFADAGLEDSCLTGCDNFIDGFRCGVKMILDVLM